MREVRNAKLRKVLDGMGIKDIALSFDRGTVEVFSDDEMTDTILLYANSNYIYGVPSFGTMTIELWVDEIKRIFDDGLERYESSMEYQKNAERDSNGHIIIRL